MKKLVVCMAAMAILAGSLGVSAQTKTNMIGTNPLGIVFGLFNLEYQKALGEKNALGISAYYWKPPLIDITLIGGSVSFNLYSKKAFHGFFVKPDVRVLSASWKYTDLLVSATELSKSAISFGVGLNAGYRWLFNSGFSIGLGGGVVYTAGSYAGIDFGGVGPSLLFDLAWAF